MRTPTSGQSSHKPGDDRIVAPCQWHDVPEQLVMDFAVDLCTRYTYRGAAQAVKLAPETVRKFVYRIGTPNLATRRRFAELYLEMNAEAVVAVQGTDKPWKARPRLTELLRPSERRARNDVAKIFELARRFPGEAPKCLDQVQEWLDLQVRGEYWASKYYGGIAHGERLHDKRSFVAAIPKRPSKPRRKPAPAPEIKEIPQRESTGTATVAVETNAPTNAAPAILATPAEPVISPEPAEAVEGTASPDSSGSAEASDPAPTNNFNLTMFELNRRAVEALRAARPRVRGNKQPRPARRSRRRRRHLAGKSK